MVRSTIDRCLVDLILILREFESIWFPVAEVTVEGMVFYEFREKEGSSWGAAVLVCLSFLGLQDTWSPLVESRRSFPFSSLKNVVSQTQILRHASIMKSRFPWELKERSATTSVRADNGPLLL